MKLLRTVNLAAVCIGAVLMLSSCNEKAKEQMKLDAQSFCQDFKDMDFQAMYDLTNDQNEYFNDIYVEGTEGSEAVFKAMADNMSYEIGECQIDGKEATVTAKISNVDMGTAMSEVLEQYFDLCEKNPDNIDNIKIADIIDEVVNDPDVQRRDADTVFNFIKQDGEWVIESNVMIYDDVTGGYMSYYFQANLAASTAQSSGESESVTEE